MLTKSLLSGKLNNKFCFDNEKASKYKILKLKRRNPFCETQCLKPSICSQSFNWIKIQTCKSQPGPKSPGYLSMSIILIIYCSDFVRNTKFTWSVRALVSLPSLLSSLVSKVRHITWSWLPNQMISLILIFGKKIIMIILVTWWSPKVAKCQFFYTEQNPWTKFYPKKSA